MPAPLIIATQQLEKGYGCKTVLQDFNLAIEQGGIHAVLGSNGAGKSTLFRILLGFVSPSRGKATILGTDSRALTPQVRARIGYVNDTHELPGWMNASQLKEQQMHFYAGWNESRYQNIAGNFDINPRRKIGNLSRGERAGLSLALALAQQPKLLLLDEPTLGLDVVAKQIFLESLIACAEDETTILYCSHQIEEVERLADQLIIIEQGKLKSQSSLDAFASRFNLWIVADPEGIVGQQELPGVIHYRYLEGQSMLYVVDEGEAFADCLRNLGARDFSSSPIGLGDAVRAFLSTQHRSSLNQEAPGC